uniref:Uncharacterized protein n=1 Tax=Cyanothece sp. (strain PCC 7425 / ATCC 29141) TaxID=395961 RepID=B8HMX2_CYAP4
MSMYTIHCHLTASEPVRRHLWYLMAGSNTPLVNNLLKLVSQHPDFETWQRKGDISKSSVEALCEPLKETYPGQPGRFYSSAILRVTYTYKSWLALQKNRRYRLEGKQRWLHVVESDSELLHRSGSSIETLKYRAQDILVQLNVEQQTQKTSVTDISTITPEETPSSKNESLFPSLFRAYDSEDDILSRCAIAYLIKNGGKIPETEEDQEKFTQRVNSKREEIEQLEIELSARYPKGRDLTGEEFLETLAIATQQLSETVAQAREWNDKILTQPKFMPYPIIYGSSTDVRWRKTSKSRITVSFNGIDKYLKAADPEIKAWFKDHQEYPFRLHCDERQLPFFQRFLEDWQFYQANKETYPAGLLTLSSTLLGWREGEGKGDPWNVNRLALYCTFDTRLMTAEGTLDVQKEKSEKALKNLAKAKPDPRNHSTLDRLKNLPVRPSRTPYQGNPEILVGLRVGLTNPITAAVVNGRTGEVLTYRTPSTLLGDRYDLFNRHRHQQEQNALERHKYQKRGVTYQPSESELGKYVDRLLAKAIIELAQTYKAGSIVIPCLTHLREILASEIAARAEEKCPGSVEAQDNYAKEYRRKIHNWSYNRLISAICSKAEQLGIIVESGFQPYEGDSYQQAKDLAIAVYHSRQLALK